MEVKIFKCFSFGEIVNFIEMRKNGNLFLIEAVYIKHNDYIVVAEKDDRQIAIFADDDFEIKYFDANYDLILFGRHLIYFCEDRGYFYLFTSIYDKKFLICGHNQDYVITAHNLRDFVEFSQWYKFGDKITIIKTKQDLISVNFTEKHCKIRFKDSIVKSVLCERRFDKIYEKIIFKFPPYFLPRYFDYHGKKIKQSILFAVSKMRKILPLPIIKKILSFISF